LLWLANGELVVGDDAGRLSFLTRGQSSASRLYQPAGPHKAVNSISQSPSDGTLAVGYDDGVVVQVDPVGPRTVRDLFSGRQIGTLAWAPNGNVLAVSSVEFDLKLLDAQGNLLTRADVGYDVNGTAWSPDGKYIAAATDDHTFKIWQVTPRQKPGKQQPTPPAFMGR
jgi:Tol biopolymer transport system component